MGRSCTANKSRRRFADGSIPFVRSARNCRTRKKEEMLRFVRFGVAAPVVRMRIEIGRDIRDIRTGIMIKRILAGIRQHRPASRFAPRHKQGHQKHQGRDADHKEQKIGHFNSIISPIGTSAETPCEFTETKVTIFFELSPVFPARVRHFSSERLFPSSGPAEKKEGLPTVRAVSARHGQPPPPRSTAYRRRSPSQPFRRQPSGIRA